MDQSRDQYWTLHTQVLLHRLSFLHHGRVPFPAPPSPPRGSSHLSDPMDCSLPGSSVHGILQARVLEWGAIAFSAVAFWQPLNPHNLRNYAPQRRQPTRLLCLWDSPGRNTGVGCHSLLQGIFPTTVCTPPAPEPSAKRPGS